MTDHKHNHKHDHDHKHDHKHDHEHKDNHEHHHHKKESNLSFDEKLNTLLTHWINHNIDHAKNYKDWSDKTRAEGKEEIADILNDVSEMTVKINEKFNQALALVKKEL